MEIAPAVRRIARPWGWLHPRPSPGVEPIRLVVVQPTSLCNMNCRYCYVPGRRDPTAMSDEVLEATIAKVLRSPLAGRRIEFLWHAGEPLTVGRAFYRRAAELVQRHNVRHIKVSQVIQTNGLLLDDEWCRFIKSSGFDIGVSIDGPAFLHDHQRVDWRGRGTHDRVMRGIALLRSHGIHFGVLCVLTRESLAYPREMFRFFVENGITSVGFNVEESENQNAISSLRADAPGATGDVLEAYRAFVSVLYDLWRVNPRALEIREFRDMLHVIRAKQSDPAYARDPDEVRPLRIITVQKNGDITVFSPEFAGGHSREYGDFKVGNVLRGELTDVLEHPTFKKMRGDVQTGVARCAATCPYFDVCGGAFTSNRYFETGSVLNTRTTTCVLHRQTLAEVLLDKLTTETAERLRRPGQVHRGAH